MGAADPVKEAPAPPYGQGSSEPYADRNNAPVLPAPGYNQGAQQGAYPSGYPQGPTYHEQPQQQNYPPPNYPHGGQHTFQQTGPGQPPERGSQICNLQMLLFLFGWIFPILWFCGAIIPLCRRQRPHERLGYLLNCIFSTLLAVAVIIAAIFGRRRRCYYQDARGYGYYGSC